ncbi:hypothetical protein ACNKHW_18115 [Shigella flexneri]
MQDKLAFWRAPKPQASTCARSPGAVGVTLDETTSVKSEICTRYCWTGSTVDIDTLDRRCSDIRSIRRAAARRGNPDSSA